MRQACAYATGAVVIALAAAAAVAAIRHPVPNFPISDLAVTETYAILASRGRLLVGPYSRFSWHHPGPIYFYLLAPFYKALGSRTVGLEVGALAINLCSMAIAMLLALRTSGRAYLFAISAAFLFLALRFQPLLTSIWNPHVIVVPAMALVVSAVSSLAGCRAALLLVSVFGSFVMQTHVSTVPAALFLAGLAVAGVVAWPDTAQDRRLARSTVAGAILVAAACWLLPLVEQVRGPEHNLSALWRYFASSSSASAHAWRPAAAAWAFGLSGAFRTDYGMPIGTPVVVPHASISILVASIGVAGLVFAGVRCWLAARRNRGVALLVPAGVCAIALFSLHRVPGSIDDHVVFWLSGIGALAVASLIGSWGSSAATRDRTGGMTTAVPALVVLVVGAAAVARLAGAGGARAADQAAQGGAARELSAAVERYVDSSRAKPLIKVDQAAWEVTAGIVVQLQRSGRPFAVEPEWLDMFTRALGPDGSETATLTIAGPELARVLGAAAGATVIGASPPFSAIVTPAVSKPAIEHRGD